MSIWNDLVLYNKVAKYCQCLCHAYIFSETSILRTNQNACITQLVTFL